MPERRRNIPHPSQLSFSGLERPALTPDPLPTAPPQTQIELIEKPKAPKKHARRSSGFFTLKEGTTLFDSPVRETTNYAGKIEESVKAQVIGKQVTDAGISFLVKIDSTQLQGSYWVNKPFGRKHGFI